MNKDRLKTAISAFVIILAILLAGCMPKPTAVITPSSAQAIEPSQSSTVATSSDVQPVEVEETLYDVEITFPASMTIGEGIDRASIESEAKKQGIHEVIFNENRTITFVMDQSTHTKLLSDMKIKIDESIDDLIKSENEVQSFSRIEYNDDLTEFTVYVDGRQYNESNSVTPVPFYIMGGVYQVLTGVDSEQTNVTVIFIDQDTGAILNTTNSAQEK